MVAFVLVCDCMKRFFTYLLALTTDVLVRLLFCWSVCHLFLFLLFHFSVSKSKLSYTQLAHAAAINYLFLACE